jgi:MFS family permease
MLKVEGKVYIDMQEVSSVASTTLWANRSYLLFWCGQAISYLGSSMATLGLPLAVLLASNSVTRMGLLSAELAAGNVVAGIVSGELIDRLDRRKVMLGCDCLSALLYGAIPFWWSLSGVDLWILYVVAAPLGFLAMTSTVAGTASIPHLVDHEQLISANGQMQMANAFAYLIGPILAGSLLGVVGAGGLLALNAATYLISAGMLCLIRLRPSSQTGQLALVTRRSQRLVAGIVFLLQERYLRWVVILRVLSFAVIAGGLDLVIFRLKHELLQGTVVVGVVWGGATLGVVGAGLLAPRLKHMFGVGACLLGGIAMMGLSMTLISLLNNAPALLLLGILLTFGDVLVEVLATSQVQKIAPAALLGRVAAGVQTSIWTGGALGAASTTFLAGWLGSTSPVFFGMGVVLFLCVGLGLLSPARVRKNDIREQ